MPKLTNAMKSYESEAAKDALNDIAKRQAIAKAKGQKYIDPGAQQGFKRDTWRNDESRPAEAQQREFLKAQQGGAPQEMPKVRQFAIFFNVIPYFRLPIFSQLSITNMNVIVFIPLTHFYFLGFN